MSIDLALEIARHNAVVARLPEAGEFGRIADLLKVAEADRDHFKKLIAGLKDAMRLLEIRLHNGEKRFDCYFSHARKDCWYWQGDGNDHLDSMSDGMTIVIKAVDLKKYMQRGR